MQKCLLVVLLTSANASRATFAKAGTSSFWTFRANRPTSGFLGDLPERVPGMELKKPTADIAKIDQGEFKAMYKQPRAEKRVSNLNATHSIAKEINTTNNINVTGDKIENEKSQEKTTEVTRTREAGLKILTKQEQKETTLASAAAAATKKAEARGEPKSKRSRGRSREVTLIESLQHMGGEEVVGCVTHCRYDERVRHPWSECLDRCVENRLMRSAMADMLPAEDHDAPHLEKEVPAQLKEQLKRHKQRMEEL